MADLRVVCDTNVYIAAALRGGQAEAVVQLAVAGAITLLVSPAILAELDEKLRDKFGWMPEQAGLFLEAVRLAAEVVEPDITLNVVEEDPDDNRILECAQAGRAALVVTYDKHLLRLKQYELIGIIHPQDLLHFGLGSSPAGYEWA
jgi:putative PIN family toxin of toxin-antitoxin system